jgi:hypothetical protein
LVFADGVSFDSSSSSAVTFWYFRSHIVHVCDQWTCRGLAVLLHLGSAVCEYPYGEENHWI